MDILVRVKILEGTRANRSYGDRVINLRHVVVCMPSNASQNATLVHFQENKKMVIQVKYENFIILLKKSLKEKFIEMKNDGEI